MLLSRASIFRADHAVREKRPRAIDDMKSEEDPCAAQTAPQSKELPHDASKDDPDAAKRQPRDEEEYFLRLRAKEAHLLQDRKRYCQIMGRLTTPEKVEDYVASFAKQARSLTAALTPFMQLMCHVCDWQYAEIWLPADAGRAAPRALKLDKHYIVGNAGDPAYDRVRKWLRRLGRHSARNGLSLPREDVVGNAFQVKLPIRKVVKAGAFGHADERMLLMELAAVSRACAFPVAIDGMLSCVVAFYGVYNTSFTAFEQSPFMEFMILSICVAYGGKLPEKLALQDLHTSSHNWVLAKRREFEGTRCVNS